MTRHVTALLATVAHAAFDNPPPLVTTPGYSPTQSDVAEAKQYKASVEDDMMLRRSPDSAAMLEYWDLTDALIDGVCAMRDAREKYIPKFADEQSKAYNFRLSCAKMTNVYGDIVEGLASKPFEQEVALVEEDDKPIPPDIEDFIENVDGSGCNLTMFAGATFFNGINSAVDWIFVDYANPVVQPKTRADEKQMGVRPYWSHVLARNILEPRSEVINGKETLTYMRILEPGAPDHVRVFERNPTTGVIGWTLYVKTQNWNTDRTTRFVVETEGTLTINVIPFVPFYTGRRNGRTWKFQPALRSAADLQVDLYRQESALNFAKQLAAFPMLAGNGVAPNSAPGSSTPAKLAIGPGQVLYAPPNASGHIGEWKFIEPAATSLKFLADDIKETIQNIRELGKQPLTAQSGMTVINSSMAAGKAKSAVGAWAMQLKNSLENAMLITAMWYGIPTTEYDPQVNVYTEFDEFTDGKDLEALQAMRVNGDISRETLWAEQKRRGVLSAEFDAEEEAERLLNELPGDPMPNDDPAPDDPLVDPPEPADPSKPAPTPPA